VISPLLRNAGGEFYHRAGGASSRDLPPVSGDSMADGMENTACAPREPGDRLRIMARRRKRPDRGAWQTHRERCHLTGDEPAAAKGEEPLPVGDVVSTVMRRLGLGEDLWVRALEQEWVELVGSAVARHARPGRYRSGRLVVFVDSAAWLNELSRYGRREMLRGLQDRFGAERIKSISLEADPDS